MPWYDFSEIQTFNDELWSTIYANLKASGLRFVPPYLNRKMHYQEQWCSGQLLLGQACGYDVVHEQSDRLKVVCTPTFNFAGCLDSKYRSFIVVKRDNPVRDIAELRGMRCVINTPTSHSGMNVLQDLVAPFATKERFFRSVDISGSHEKSLLDLSEDRADVAAIDCITFGLLKKYRPSAIKNIRTIHETIAVPAPPFVTSAKNDASTIESLRNAIGMALPSKALGLESISYHGKDTYLPIAKMASKANVKDFSNFI